MSEFFKSELVRGDIQEMAALQEFCFKSVTNLALLDKEGKLEYFEALKKLLDKQKIFHARLMLSDDPEAKSVAENMKQAVIMLGGDPNLDVNKMFDDLLKKIEEFETQVDNAL
jgi:hypothetical protein|tara:strand:+ start:6290 stop:6628 length:339 start_codon:yes stop_codon:yes gene_type:complete